MIIQSLLDTDLYKFTMMQVVLHHFPGAQVEYKFRCRTEGVNLQPDLPHLVNKKLTAAQLFDGKNQACHRAAITDPDTGDGVEIAQQPAFVDSNGW